VFLYSAARYTQELQAWPDLETG